jgi:predicted RNase H-like HicB family nuclease
MLDSKYEIIIYWSKEDDAFIAEVPELSGCMPDAIFHVNPYLL